MKSHLLRGVSPLYLIAAFTHIGNTPFSSTSHLQSCQSSVACVGGLILSKSYRERTIPSLHVLRHNPKPHFHYLRTARFSSQLSSSPMKSHLPQRPSPLLSMAKLPTRTQTTFYKMWSMPPTTAMSLANSHTASLCTASMTKLPNANSDHIL